MTIKDLAAASGLNPSTISYLEADKTIAEMPNLRRLAEILGVPVAFLGCFESLPEETLGQRITKARKCCGMMMKEFASILGVNVKTLRCWEKNSLNPSKGKYKNLVLYLDILGTNYGNNNLPL